MHFNYKSKAAILLDCDKAGNDAKKKIENAKKEFQKKSFKLKVIQIQPTEDMKIVQAKIQKSLIFANSHFLRTAGPHFPDSPGHIKRTAWDISRAEGTPPH